MSELGVEMNEEQLGRRERRQAETREKLFRTALRLFSQRGFSAVTVEEITEAADLGKGTFFNYFPSKEHVLAAFGQIQVGKVEAALARVEGRETTAAEALHRLPQELAAEPGRSAALARSLMVAINSNDAARGLMMANLQRGRELLGRLIWICQEKGEIRKDRLALDLARAFQETFFGTLFVWAQDPAQQELGNALADAFEIFWSGAENAR